MSQTLTLSTRDFMHSFRTIKEQLKKREVARVVIQDRSGDEFELVIHNKVTPIEKAREIARSGRLPKITRLNVDLFSHDDVFA